ncbi:MAG: transposase [Symploca sp. SIO2E6]|nr:transposase [Symploca sp. SIO2E6]
MKYNPQIHHRRSIRLKDYDYSQPGVYFVTICTNDRQCWFGEIHDSQMCLNQLGKIVAQGWLRTPEIRPEVILDEWTIMPNHLHGIIIITHQPTPPNNHVGAHRRAPSQCAPNQCVPNQPQFRRKSKSLASIIAGFKSSTTKRINQVRATPRVPLWERNYYESIVRNTEHLEHVRNYIWANPYRWKDDPEYSSSTLINSFDLPF